ncbi:ABC-type nitrate/sulfonate/bicarbonate transport systems, periplasmic component [Archaeoglobus sulfaticallidus PM70-1]|uniref:ABC-type nitrate/sulfonate/bicarbonate transport systems, periplasmic component n=1 Tax=Archaeoglobus sulfaticallidus PM70-1 TaxID=387631 RepID=N0BBW0_9EURY|nr:MetQ/NlpA family ABC transporter substrate-binding protein [Archaeoglobus sulfaticallidus]AGK60478.1 ABC-type nitrate/sulfonate/bicarbonate transport systems, periplasmic component [Archaeoglobus sulfaticallidus PM70-1]
MKKLTLCVLAIVLITLTALSGCTQEKKTLKIGILPIEDSLPIVVADEEKIFEKYGLDVEVVTFQSALERDSAFTSASIDGMITDPLDVILLKNSGVDVKIVSLCLGKTPSEGVFAVLASPNSQIEKPEDLAGKQVAISKNTIIEFVTDMMLRDIPIEKIEIKKIPLRMQALLDNKVDAAVLPEPLASFAESKGAKRTISDADFDKSISQTVIVMKGDVDTDTVKRFLKAYDEAVEQINSNPSKYRSKFIEIARVPQDIAEKYNMPLYPKSQKFPKEFYDRYLEWAMEKGLAKEVPYENVVEWVD